MSNVVAPLLATFDLCLERFFVEVPLYILEDFYMGPASLKTSPPLGISPVRKRVQALERIFKTKGKEKWMGLHLYLAEATHLQIRCKICVSYRCSRCGSMLCLLHRLGRRTLVFRLLLLCKGLPTLAGVSPHLVHLFFLLRTKSPSFMLFLTIWLSLHFLVFSW
jgi:hypothetical protein